MGDSGIPLIDLDLPVLRSDFLGVVSAQVEPSLPYTTKPVWEKMYTNLEKMLKTAQN